MTREGRRREGGEGGGRAGRKKNLLQLCKRNNFIDLISLSVASVWRQRGKKP